ncbi:MAG: NADAR family protein [Parachlamydia sp.]|nr:NADAR family protein [Parachlamydia sp.]
MKINKEKYDELQSVPLNIRKACLAASWKSWSRPFVVKADGDFRIVTLNIFNRLTAAFLRIFHINYFNRILGAKEVTLVNRAELIQADQKAGAIFEKNVLRSVKQPIADQFNTQQLQTNFFNWVERARSQGHFTPGHEGHIKAQFQKHFSSVRNVAAAESGKTHFFQWVQRALTDGHFNQGQVNHIQTSFEKAFNFCKPAAAAPQPGQGTLESIARKDHFVWFYDSTNSLTYFLGNFYPCRIAIYGHTFACSEAAFQAAKFAHNPILMAQFSNLDGDAAWRKAGELNRQGHMRADWMQIRDRVMDEVLEAKFRQNPHLSQALLATGRAYLVEHNNRKGKDSHWSDDHDGSGENMLGKVLMAVRHRLGGEPAGQPPQKYWDFVRSGR